MDRYLHILESRWYIPADTGPSYWEPGVRYTFLVTGAQTNGGYFIIEAIIPPGGGPTLHIQHREEESLYLLEGILNITPGEKKVKATTGDFVQSLAERSTHFSTQGARRPGCCSFSRPPGWINISRRCCSRFRTAPPLYQKYKGVDYLHGECGTKIWN